MPRSTWRKTYDPWSNEREKAPRIVFLYLSNEMVVGELFAELIAELFIASAPSRAGLAIAPARETVADGARIIIMWSGPRQNLETS